MQDFAKPYIEAVEVIKRHGVTKQALIERKKLIDFPKDPETLLFNKNL